MARKKKRSKKERSKKELSPENTRAEARDGAADEQLAESAPVGEASEGGTPAEGAAIADPRPAEPPVQEPPPTASSEGTAAREPTPLEEPLVAPLDATDATDAASLIGDGEDESIVIDLDAELAEDDAYPVHEVDADLDMDPDVAAAVERLIAETTASARAGADALEPDEPTPDPAPSAARATPEETILEAIDLGPVSSPELRDRLLAQALAHAEHQEARYRVPFTEARGAGRWKGLVAVVLLLLAATIAVAPPRWIRPDAPAELGPADRSRSVRVALLLQAEQVEAFRVRTQGLPSTLAELSINLPGVRYVRSGNRAYQLIVYEADGRAVVYDSSNPTPPFRSLSTGWSSGQREP